MAELALGKEFLSYYGHFAQRCIKKVDKLLDMFRDHTHAGLNLEKPSAVVDERARTVRVGKFWRGVVTADPQNKHITRNGRLNAERQG